MHSLLDVQPASDHAPHHESESVPNDTRIMLLAAVPYVAGVGTHLVNAMHSHRVHERRCAGLCVGERRVVCTSVYVKGGYSCTDS